MYNIKKFQWQTDLVRHDKVDYGTKTFSRSKTVKSKKIDFNDFVQSFLSNFFWNLSKIPESNFAGFSPLCSIFALNIEVYGSQIKNIFGENKRPKQ